MRFDGKTVVITGAGSGQGKASAKLFAEEGAGVALIDKNEEGVKNTAMEIRSFAAGKVTVFPADITIEEEVEKAMRQIADIYGAIDILVNCAGRTAPAGKETMEELTIEEWKAVLDVNLIGPWLCIKYAVPVMRRKKSGAIVNVSSTAGIRAIPGASPYCVSKAGLSMLTKTAALEYIPCGIRVNGVMPGHIDTPMMASVIHEMEKNGLENAYHKVHKESNPIKRLGTAEEVANAILFLSSDESSFLVGTEIYVDGGFSAG